MIRYAFCLLILWLAVAILPTSADAASEIIRLGSDHPYSLFIDTGGKRTIDEIAALPAESFRPVSGELSLGYTGAAAWLRFDLPPADWPGNQWLLELAPPFLDSIQLYEPDESGWRMRETGDHFLYSQREIRYRFFMFHLYAPEHSSPPTSIYLRIKTTSSLYLIATLWSPDEFAHHVGDSLLLWGGYFGLLILALLFTIVMTTINRSRRFMIASISVMITATLTALIQGLFACTPLGENPFLADTAVGVLTALALATAIANMREFAIRDASIRWLDRCYLAAVGYCIVVLPLSILFNFYTMAIRVGLLLNLLATIGTVIVLIVCKNQSSTYKRIMLYVIFTYSVSYTSTFLMLNGIIAQSTLNTLLRAFELFSYTLLACAVLLYEIRQTYKRQVMDKADELERSIQTEHALEFRVAERTAELQSAQQSLQAALDNEHELLSEQRQFLSMVSHEFRTPLSVIDAIAVNLLAVPLADDFDMAKRVQKIRKSTQSLSQLVANCMTSERIELGGFIVIPMEIEILPLIMETAKQVDASLQHTVQLNFAEAPATWRLDPTLIKVAISNLIDNAVKYSAGGTITITLLRCGDELSITVTDQGGGIPLKDVDIMFEKFVRGSVANSGKGIRGTGLGLYISRRIARAHGGDLRLLPSENGTTVFELRVP